MAEVEVQNLVKTYENEKVVAVNKVTFSVNKGELFGLIGPDGAGKSSIFRILTSLLLPDHGQASVCSFDVKQQYKEIRKRVGYMPGRFSLYQDLSVEENLNLFASVFKTTVKENYELIRDIYMQLEPFKKRRAGQLSGGMKQKLALCCALIHRPEVLFLDEPTTGVDPVSRKEFWQILKRLQQNAITILVSTPYMDEAALCDTIALIDKGEILKIDSPANIIKQFDKILWAVETNQKHQLLQDLRANAHVASCFAFGTKIHCVITNGRFNTEELKKYLENKGHSDIGIDRIEAAIEDCFIQLMQEEKLS